MQVSYTYSECILGENYPQMLWCNYNNYVFILWFKNKTKQADYYQDTKNPHELLFTSSQSQ